MNTTPVAVLLEGLIGGALLALTAAGLVLVYRASGVVNFAQAQLGVIGAVLAFVLVGRWRVPWILAVPVGLVVAATIGALVDVAIVQRLRTAPRVIVAVATIGLADALTGGGDFLGRLTGTTAVHGFGAPVHLHLSVFPAVFSADDLLAIVGAAAVLGALAWFLRDSDVGIALRAASENVDRAQLAGIPVRLVTSLAWAIAAALAALAVMLRIPVDHVTGTAVLVVGGLPLLLRALTAGVIGRMENLPRTVVAALAIGVFDEVTRWTTRRTTYADALLVVVLLVALVAQRDAFTRTGRTTGPEWQVLGRTRPTPEVLNALPEVRWARRAAVAVPTMLAVSLPLWASADLDRGAALVLIYGVAALSLVPLLGWTGQVSLGQFAFAGLGGATTAVLYQRHGWDLLVALPVGIAVAAGVALVIGLPATRIRGPFLAVTTLAFAVTASSYLLDSRFFPWLVQDEVARPVLWSRLPLTHDWQMYEACLAALALTVAALANLRRTRTGRALIAVRDNPDAAEAAGLSTARLTMTAFGIGGAIAGFAGGLYVVQQQGFHTDAFGPEVSVRLFAMVVIGGLGSVPGALLGVLYVRGTELLLPDAWAALATGTGLLALLLLFPEGLGGALTRARERALRSVARRRGIAIGILDVEREDEVAVS